MRIPQVARDRKIEDHPESDSPTRRFEITAAQCKICGLPPFVRWNIEMELVTGWSQTQVKLRWNEFLAEHDPEIYGAEYLNNANLSTHFKKHVSTRESAIRQIIETQAQHAFDDIEAVKGLIITKQGVAEAIAVSGLQNVAKGLTIVEPRETLAAVQILKDLEAETGSVAVDELWRQFYAFQEAVRKVVPQDLYEQIAFEFKNQLGDTAPELVAREVMEDGVFETEDQVKEITDGS